VDIGEFYDQDDRRRSSSEVELGTEWRDARDVRYELNWVKDTGELYTMCEPFPPEWEGIFTDVHVNIGPSAPIGGMTVVVLAHIGTEDELEKILEGWQDQMGQPDSASWLAARLKETGVADPAWAGPD